MKITTQPKIDLPGKERLPTTQASFAGVDRHFERELVRGKLSAESMCLSPGGGDRRAKYNEKWYGNSSLPQPAGAAPRRGKDPILWKHRSILET